MLSNAGKQRSGKSNINLCLQNQIHIAKTIKVLRPKNTYVSYSFNIATSNHIQEENGQNNRLSTNNICRAK